MRILVVTSQFPIAGEPTRGRPILQTVRELAKLAEVPRSPLSTLSKATQLSVPGSRSGRDFARNRCRIRKLPGPAHAEPTPQRLALRPRTA